MSARKGVGLPFTAADHQPVRVLAELIGQLDAIDEHPEIGRVRAAALDALAPRPGQRLLEAGCGTGRVARMLGRLVGPGGSVTAVDISAEMVQVARERHDGGPVRYAVGDVTALDAADATFDGVRCERVLHHVVDPDAAIGELVRVTRPGGRICLIDPDFASMVYDGADERVGEVYATFLASLGGNATMGRTCRRRLIRAGLSDVMTLPVTMRFTEWSDADVVLPLVNRRLVRTWCNRRSPCNRRCSGRSRRRPGVGSS